MRRNHCALHTQTHSTSLAHPSALSHSNQISSVAPATTAPNHSNHNIFRCDELLEPFILTCNPSSPPSMVSIALNGLNYLLTSSAILPDSMLQVMTALTSVGLTPPQVRMETGNVSILR